MPLTPTILALLAGQALAGTPTFSAAPGEPVHTLPRHAWGNAQFVAHMHIAPTGERVFLDEYAPPPEYPCDTRRWILTKTTNRCPDVHSAVRYAVDPDYIAGGNPVDPSNPDLDSAYGYVAIRDWGDLYGDGQLDMTIDFLTTAFTTRYADPTPDDGIIDPVPGNTLNIRFEDGQDGGNSPLNNASLHLATVSIPDLPSAHPSHLVNNADAEYFVTIDLGATGQAFELGDRNLQRELECVGDRINFGSFADVDGESSHDFSWDFYFDQPGVDPQDPSTYANAVRQGIPAAYPPPKVWPTSNSYPIPGRNEAKDLFTILDLRNTDASDPFDEQGPSFAGNEHFGGFECSGPNATPWAGFEMQLYSGASEACGEPCTRTACDVADFVHPFNQVTFADLTYFLNRFSAGLLGNSSEADIALPFGRLTFADITTYLTAFTEASTDGCQ